MRVRKACLGVQSRHLMDWMENDRLGASPLEVVADGDSVVPIAATIEVELRTLSCIRSS